MEFLIFKFQKFRFSSLALKEFGITIVRLKYHQSSSAIPPKYNCKLRKAIICYAPSRDFDYLIMKFDLISVIFRRHGLSTFFRDFLKNVKIQEPKTYITILSIPQVISGRNIKGSIFPTLCHIFSISLGSYRESLLSGLCTATPHGERKSVFSYCYFLLSRQNSIILIQGIA